MLVDRNTVDSLIVLRPATSLNLLVLGLLTKDRFLGILDAGNPVVCKQTYDSSPCFGADMLASPQSWWGALLLPLSVIFGSWSVRPVLYQRWAAFSF